MDNQVEEIKSKLDIVNLISSYLPLKKKGRNFWANCPFHGEKTPSFSVSPELQIYKCFGCGVSGDIFSFLENYEKIDFKEALETLAKQAGVTLRSNPAQTGQDRLNQKIIQINHYVADFYHYVLTHHPQGKVALSYLKDRLITDATIKLFRLGFAPPEPKHLLNFLTKKGFSHQEILETGTFGQKGNYTYDRFRNRLVFPLFDHRDRIVAFSGRILPTDPNQGMGKYINSPETPVYHKGHMLFGLNLAKESIRKSNCVIVVEGEFDLISPFQAGFKNIVALKGTAFTDNQLTLLKRYTQNLVLALDSDFAGISASRKSILLADSLGFNIKAVDLGKFKDPDDAIKGNLAYFKKQVKNAASVWDFVINTAIKTYPPSTDLGKKQILEFTFPFLTQIDNQVLRSTYLAKLANLLNVDREAIVTEAAKFSRSQTSSSPSAIILPKPTQAKDPLRTEKLQHLILVLLFSQANPVRFYKQLQPNLDIFSLPQFQKIIDHLVKYKRKVFSPKKFAASLPEESVDLFNHIYIQSQNEIQDETWTVKKITKLSSDIKIIDLKTKQEALSTKIALAEHQKNKTQLKKLELKYNQLLTELSTLQST